MINFQTFAITHYLKTEGHMSVAAEQTRSLPLDGKIMYLKELINEISADILAYQLLHDAIQQVDWITVAREVDKYAGV